MGCEWVGVLVEWGFAGVATMPVVVVDALTMPVKDVHVVDHDARLDECPDSVRLM